MKAPFRPAADFILMRFPYFMALYFLCHFILRIVSNNTLTIDESEQMILAQQFDFGYNAQPPLYTWIQILFFKILGESIFAIAILKNGFLFLLFLFTYLSAKEITNEKTISALCSISMVLLFQIAWVAQIDQIHSVAVTTSSAAVLYLFLRISKQQKPIDYLLLGIACGCGLLFKYNILLLILAILLVSWLSPDLRRSILSKKIGIAVGVAAIIVLPHALWFLENTNTATAETINRMHFDQTNNPLINRAYGFLDLLLAIVAFITPFWLIFLVFFRKNIQTSPYPENIWLSRIFVTIFILILTVIIIIGTSNIKERWLQPYLFFLPLWSMLHVKASAIQKKAPHFAITVAVVMFIVLLAIPIRLISMDIKGKPHRENFPFEKLSMAIKKNGFHQGLIVAENMFIGGNLRLFFKTSQVLTPDTSLQKLEVPGALLFLWHNKKPVLPSVVKKTITYQCQEFEEKLLFKFSNSMLYNPHYTICNK